MTLTQLRTFLAVADTASVRAAAERLVVSQPSVSAAVASLEKELGVALVARQGRGLRVTAAGVAFAARVRESLG
ncbi:MAG: LysR family transcriptional regulator, partial [Actinomycetota bacterium]|nr:LysR family transcriptional regulator [Actinomycetota bacterium]